MITGPDAWAESTNNTSSNRIDAPNTTTSSHDAWHGKGPCDFKHLNKAYFSFACAWTDQSNMRGLWPPRPAVKGKSGTRKPLANKFKSNPSPPRRDSKSRALEMEPVLIRRDHHFSGTKKSRHLDT